MGIGIVCFERLPFGHFIQNLQGIVGIYQKKEDLHADS